MVRVRHPSSEGGRQQYGAEHLADVRTLQPRRGGIGAEKEAEILGPP